MKSLNVSDRSIRYVRDRVQALMTSTIAIYDRARPVFNPTTGNMEPTVRYPVYYGPARVWESDKGAVIIQGDVEITQITTHISIPFESYEPGKDEIVRVISCPQDQSIVDKCFRIVSVDGSGQIGAVRRMTCTSYTDSLVWEE